MHKCYAMLVSAGQHLTLCSNTSYIITHIQQPCLERALLMAEKCIYDLCRPEWAHLARQPGESPADCDKRLRKIFSFNSTAAGQPVKIEQAPESRSHAQKPPLRPAAAKRKLGSDTPTILAEKPLPGGFSTQAVLHSLSECSCIA